MPLAVRQLRLSTTLTTISNCGLNATKKNGLRSSHVTDAAYAEEIHEHAQELMDCWPGLDYEAALSRARIELGRRAK